MKEISLNVKGMMCTGCETRVKRTLESIDGIESVDANYETGIVKVILNKEVDVDIINATIEEIGYEVNN